MSNHNEPEVIPEDQDESEKRYSDYKISSAEDAIAQHFTPEQRRQWTELIVANNDVATEQTNMTPNSPETKECLSNASGHINKCYTKEERKWFAELMLGTDEDNKTNQNSKDGKPEKFGQTNERQSKVNSLYIEEEPEKRYSDYKISSAEDAILRHFTPQQRRNWTEFIVASKEDQPKEKTNERPVSKQFENKCNENESTFGMTNDLKENTMKLSKILLQRHNIVIGEQLTESTFGYIAYGSHRHNKRIAIKVIDLIKSGNKGFDGNSFAMKQLKHKNIVEVFDLVKEKNLLFVVMPLAQMDLFQYLSNEGALGESQAKVITYHILRGVQYIHGKGWAHRDIKLENCLFFGCETKICDFDLMTRAIDDKGKPVPNSERIGTLVYMAPELLNGKGSPDLRMSDLWSCGILLFALLTYSYAFGAIEDLDDSKKALQNMRYKRYLYPKHTLLSIQWKSFIDKLLEFDPYSRSTVDQLLSDKWVSTQLFNNNHLK